MPTRDQGRLARVLIVALLAAAAFLASPAGPASPAGAATPPSLDDFRLRPTDLDLQGRVDQLSAELPRRGVQDLLAEANREATSAPAGDPCMPTAFGGRAEPAHWCLDDADTGTIDGDEGSGNVEWMPQGVTTVADADDGEVWDTRRPILVSWYDKRLGTEKGVRVSFLDPDTGRYQHVLLAYPYTNSAGEASYEYLDTPQSGDNGGIHAGGIAWYGNYLYVADTTRGVRVFDMRYIFDLETAGNGDTTDGDRVGRHGDTYYGFGYRYVMPQVDAWVNDAGPDNDGDGECENSGAPKFSYVSVDRSATPHQLVTGEYCRAPADETDDDAYGRVATWPLDAGSGRPQPDADGVWRASSAHRLPRPNIQGAVSHDGTWFLSRSRGEDDNGHFVEAAASGSPTGTLSATATRWGGIGVEDLSYWPSQDAIWTVTEHPGRRAIYSCPRVAPPGSAGAVCGSAG